MSYQSIIRNEQGHLIPNNAVGMRLSILQGSADGEAVYVETHTPITNGNSSVTIEIGNGEVVSGVFEEIDWSTGLYWLQTEIDPQGSNGYSITGTFQLISVPYALYAESAGNFTGTITEADPVFVSSPAFGITDNDITFWDNKLDAEVDGSITNELQILSISNDTIYLSNGGYVKLPAGFSGDYNDLINTPDIPSNISELNNDAGYITDESDPVFTTWDKDYNDLINQPTIPAIPENVSVFINDAGYVTNDAEIDPIFTAWDKDYFDLLNIPTNVSTFNNDAGYLTNFTEQDTLIWKLNGENVYYNNGNVGIGTKTPLGKLHLNNDFVDSDSSFIVKENGNVGIGMATPDSKLFVFNNNPQITTNSKSQFIPSLSSDQNINLHNQFNQFYASSNFNFNCGIYGVVNRVYSTAEQTGTIKFANGSSNDFYNFGLGDVESGRGSYNSVINYSTSVIDKAYGLISEVKNIGDGIINNGYGIFINTVQATNKWSIYAQDTTAPSYFAGNVGIGVSSPQYKLHVMEGDFVLQSSGSVNPYICYRDETGFLRIRLSMDYSNIVSTYEMDVYTPNSTANAGYRFFRHTNTTGNKDVSFYRGNGSLEKSALIGVDGSNSYFNLHGGNLGIGTSIPSSKLSVSDGDINILSIGSGVIMKSPNGQCWRVTIDNSGNFISTAITCP